MLCVGSINQRADFRLSIKVKMYEGRTVIGNGDVGTSDVQRISYTSLDVREQQVNSFLYTHILTVDSSFL